MFVNFYSLDVGIMQTNNQKELMSSSFYSLLHYIWVGGPPECSFA